MRALVDTHVFLWWVEGNRALPPKARAALGDPDNKCLISLVPIVSADPVFRAYGVKRIW